MKSASLALAAVIAVAACAKQPDRIPAADIGPNPYTRLSCSALAAQKITLDQKLENLSAAQKNAAAGDTVGVLLLGVPLSSMSGNDKETPISIAKAQLQAVAQVQAAKRCK